MYVDFSFSRCLVASGGREQLQMFDGRRMRGEQCWMRRLPPARLGQPLHYRVRG